LTPRSIGGCNIVSIELRQCTVQPSDAGEQNRMAAALADDGQAPAQRTIGRLVRRDLALHAGDGILRNPQWAAAVAQQRLGREKR